MVRKAPRTAFYFIQSAMTGFSVSAFLSRNRVSPKEAFEGLELCERKLSCTVLRGLDGSNPVRLLGDTGGTGVGFWPCQWHVASWPLEDEKTRENSNFRKIEMANIKTEALSDRT